MGKASGREVAPQAPLPDAGPDTWETITIYSQDRKVVPQPSDHIKAALEALPITELHVPANTSKHHPIIRAWIDKHERALERDRLDRRSKEYVIGFLETKPLTPLEKRRHRILSALLVYMEKQGYVVEIGHRQDLFLTYHEIKIQISLSEKIRQYRRPLTEKEKANSIGDSKWRQEKEPTGLLIFKVHDYLDTGLKTEWLESAMQSMEEMLPEIARTLLVAGPSKLQKEKDRQEKVRLTREAAWEKQKVREHQLVDVAQWKSLMELASVCVRAKQVQELLSALETRSESLDGASMIGQRSIHEWIEWGKHWAGKYDLANVAPTDVFEPVSQARPTDDQLRQVQRMVDWF